MNMKKYTADTMQQALKLIREELGPDAVILSSRKTDQGVEISCAVDYSEDKAREELPEVSRNRASSGDVAREAVARQDQLERELAAVKQKMEQLVSSSDQDPFSQKADKRPELRRSESRSEKLPETTRNSRFADLDPQDAPVSQRPRQEPGSIRREPSLDSEMPISVKRPADQETQSVIAEMRNEIMELRNLLQTQKQDKTSDQNFSEQVATKASFADHLSMSMAPDTYQTMKSPENLAGDSPQLPQDLKERFVQMGLMPEVQALVQAGLKPNQEKTAIWRTLMSNLSHHISTEEDELIDQEGAIALVGPTGVGKTTTIAKLAARFVIKHGADQLALVTTDRFRIAASQQLQSIGRLLNVPVFVVNDKKSLDDMLDRLSTKQLVLVDTAGLNPFDNNWEVQKKDLQTERHLVKKYVVLSAVTQLQVMKSNYHYYKMLGIDGCIMTKLDEACSLGEVISMAIMNQLPVAYYSDGQQIPQDLHHAKAHALVVKAVSMVQKSAGNHVQQSA